MMPVEIQCGGRLKTIQMGTLENGKVCLKFGYDKPLIARIKAAFENRKWENELKMWSFPITQRNTFQFKRLRGENMHQRYDDFIKTNPEAHPKRDAQWFAENKPGLAWMAHQGDMLSYFLNVKQILMACEMGTGKTLGLS